MVAFTCGRLPWTAREYSLRMAKGVVSKRRARRHIQYVAFVLLVGICRRQLSLTLYWLLLAVNVMLTQSSNRQVAGTTMMEKNAMERMITRFLRCRLATRSTVALLKIIMVKIQMLSFGGLRSTAAFSRLA